MKNNIRIKQIVAVCIATILIATAIFYKIYVNGKNNIIGSATKQSDTTNGEKISSGYEAIFKKDGVIDIKVEIPEKDFKSILDDPMAEEYKSAKVTVGDVTLDNVGFRTKGNLTLRSVANSSSDRYSFRIKLDKYVNGENFLGLDEFVVNNMYSDPSYMREYLSYEALKSIGADVPETVFANLYINGKLYGFYLCVEALDDSFLEKNFGSNNGNLYKQEQGSTLQYVEGSNYDKSELKVGEDETKADLKNFIKVLNEMPQGQKGDIEKVLDVDSALRYIAANTVLGNYDSYSGNLVQNYYLYGQEGKFTVIPWDYNMSMAGFGGGNLTTIPIDEPVIGVNIKNLPLINNLLAVDEYKTKYHEYVKQLLSYLDNFEKRVEGLATIIKPYVEADPSKFYTMEQFEANIKYSTTDASANTNIPIGSSQDKAQNKPDATTGASQNANQGAAKVQRPQDMPGVEKGDRPAPPQGDMKGGPGGGMMGGSTSIVSYIRDRVENVKKQLSGELPTTDNTTMNDSRMGGRK